MSAGRPRGRRDRYRRTRYAARDRGVFAVARPAAKSRPVARRLRDASFATRSAFAATIWLGRGLRRRRHARSCRRHRALHLARRRSMPSPTRRIRATTRTIAARWTTCEAPRSTRAWRERRCCEGCKDSVSASGGDERRAAAGELREHFYIAQWRRDRPDVQRSSKRSRGDEQRWRSCFPGTAQSSGSMRWISSWGLGTLHCLDAAAAERAPVVGKCVTSPEPWSQRSFKHAVGGPSLSSCMQEVPVVSCRSIVFPSVSTPPRSRGSPDHRDGAAIAASIRVTDVVARPDADPLSPGPDRTSSMAPGAGVPRAGAPTRRYDRSIVEGPLRSAVWKNAWPTMLTNIIGGLQGIIDHVMVGPHRRLSRATRRSACRGRSSSSSSRSSRRCSRA